MTASFTCHRHLSPGGGYDDDYAQPGNNPHNKNSNSLHILRSTLTSTPLHSNPGQVPSSLSILPSPDLSARTISPTVALGPSKALAHPDSLSEACMLVPSALDRSSTPSSMETDIPDSTRCTTPTSPPSRSPSQALHRTPKRKRTVSPPSPSSKYTEQLRSASRSTHRSTPHSRGSSLHSHRRTATTASLTPSVSDSPARRENLLALHRESCRLFQDPDIISRPPTQARRSASPGGPPFHPPRPIRTSSNLSSPPVSPILSNRPSISTREKEYSRPPPDQDHSPVHSLSTIQPVPTVIDWTSPSTRRREYEEIDRATSGVRGFWRRVAPRWCQFGDSRVPFFEEGKDGKGNYEGSVRRFRMDIPDEPTCERSRRGLNLKKKLVVTRLKSRS